MSREFKFRAWDKITKQIFEVREIDFMAIERNVYGLITYKSILGGVNESLSFRSFDNIELMQYTGLKDKHNTDIYEGDIIRFGDGEIVEVVFFCGAFMPKLNKCQGITINDNSKPIWQDGEIIGNIFENKELLK